MIPRMLIAGTNSGCGKTTVTCGILQALVNRGLWLMACKSGPDYIDPMFHSRVIGTESCNLDPFFAGADLLRSLLAHHGAGRDLVVMEGAMGFYDGIAMTSQASAWTLSQATQTPVVLVVDGRGSGVSLCATISGFLRFQPENQLKGVILNRISPMLYPRLKKAVEEKCGVAVYGYLPELPQCRVESRHLGLLTAGEIGDLKDRLQALAEQAERSLDLNGLLALARSVPPVPALPLPVPARVPGEPVIAVARDEAFCFYYRDNLELLERLGAKLVYFSPLHDQGLPACHGLYLGGGYPELYAGPLSQKAALRQQLRQAIQGGMPTVAECGGFLYLQQELEDSGGNCYPMCGVLPGKGYPTPRLQRFGYVTLTAREDSLLCEKGGTLLAHEFHYWDCQEPGRGFHAQKPLSDRSWDCGKVGERLYAGFPHLYFYANPMAAVRFVTQAAEYKKEKP